MSTNNIYRAPEPSSKIIIACRRVTLRPNRALLKILSVLQKHDEPIGTTAIARECSEDRDRTQRALLRLHDMRFVEHAWSDESPPSKEHGREGTWILRPLQDIYAF